MAHNLGTESPKQRGLEAFSSTPSRRGALYIICGSAPWSGWHSTGVAGSVTYITRRFLMKRSRLRSLAAGGRTGIAMPMRGTVRGRRTMHDCSRSGPSVGMERRWHILWQQESVKGCEPCFHLGWHWIGVDWQQESVLVVASLCLLAPCCALDTAVLLMFLLFFFT